MEKKYVFYVLHYLLYYGNFIILYVILYYLFKKYAYPFFVFFYNQKNTNKNLLLEKIQKQKKMNTILKYDYEKKLKIISFYRGKMESFLSFKSKKRDPSKLEAEKEYKDITNAIFFQINNSLIEETIRTKYDNQNDFSFALNFISLKKDKKNGN
jgi:hypothetical protein